MPDPSKSQPPNNNPAGKPASPRQTGERGIDPVMADLVKTSAQATAKACPQCKAFLGNSAVICTTCGYNLQTGKTMSTQVVREKAAKAAKAPSAASNFENPLTMETPWVFFGILFAIAIAPGVLLMNESTAVYGQIASGVFGLASLAMAIFLLVVAFRESVVQGLALIVCWLLSCLLLPAIYLLYYVFVKTEDPRIKGGYAGMFLGYIISLFLAWDTIQAQIDSQRNAPQPTPPAATGRP
jgi:hypothetical protein